MAEGIAKWFNERKDYGFMEQETGPDVFVHHSGVSGERPDAPVFLKP